MTSADAEDNATSTRMSYVIRDYIASSLITVEDDEAQRQLNTRCEDVGNLQPHTFIIEGREEESGPCSKGEYWGRLKHQLSTDEDY